MKAFPTGKTGNKNYDFYVSQDGMDLRDYFAAKAMQAIITNSDEKSLEVQEVEIWIGNYAYAVADAMMKAREVK